VIGAVVVVVIIIIIVVVVAGFATMDIRSPW
jgi:hypothetical protein